MKRLIYLLFLSLALKSYGQNNAQFFDKEDLMSLGIYYYPEHWNKADWERDLKNISEIGFEFIHLAEFAWAEMEPQENVFALEWLDEIIELAKKNKLKVILGTPTSIAPVWMGIKYPEIYLMNSDHVRAEHGTRDQQSLCNPVWLDQTKKIVAKLAERYGNNPTVIGWQIDNEPWAKDDFSPSSQKAFQKWLQQKYSTIAHLNKAWGTAFWSQTYGDFNQIKIPNAKLVGWWGVNPHALLDFRRYSADIQAYFLDYQADILRSIISPDQYITTNYTATTYAADPKRTKKLDFDSFTSYPNKGSSNLGSLGFRLGDPKELSFATDFFKSANGITGIMELQPGFVNWGSINPLLQPGALRMWLYHCFGGGLSFACSYRYRQINYGAEQYHSGIVKLDGQTLSQGGVEYKKVIEEMKFLRENYIPNQKIPEKLNKRKTALVWNHDNLWSLGQQGQTTQWNTLSFFQKYLEIAKSFGAPTDIIESQDNLSDYKIVIIPAYELVEDQIVEKWMDYVKNGGNLVLTLRTGVKDVNGHFFNSAWGEKIYPLINASIENFDQLLPHHQGVVKSGNKDYFWNNWAELIQPNDPKNSLAVYADQFYAGKSAAVTNKLGKGTITYIGVDTDEADLEKDILRHIYQKAGADTENYPKGVYVNWRDGFWVAVNYSSEVYSLDIPTEAQILLGNQLLNPAEVTVWKD